ncbi:hypothetical protein [Paenibacillus oleatilyticus]|uniref:hypothetical protein n=1 Tax=Paenibacillus oleatilyticus TaxID=2594886 RepID=UPI001C1FBC2D|nr:hypothetical protein [Paenibacillus oleatilyticus]MBU7315283.1 hypothetical protein [Paenibacillus oleatilyticus]
MTRINITLLSERDNHLLMTIKKHTGLGLLEIKTRISNINPLMEVDYVNINERKKMKDFVEDLIKHKANFKLLEHDEDYKEELPLEYFMNSFKMARQIAEDRERIDDILGEEDNE